MEPKDMIIYRHPRTLLEAFGVDADSAKPIHRYAGRSQVLPATLAWLAAVAAIYAAGYWMTTL